MRRADREVTEFKEIIDILNRCDTIRLGINDIEYTYVVPLSFGFEITGPNITVYIHGANYGLKHDLIAKDNKVCIEASLFHKFTEVSKHKSITTEYESFIGFGKAEIVSGYEAIKGLKLICSHAGFNDFDFGGEKVLDVCRVYKIRLDKFTAKRLLE